MTRDEARAARDRMRVALTIYRDAETALNGMLYVGGNYNPDLLPVEREALSERLSEVGHGLIKLARIDRAYNDIIAYRADAKLNPEDRDHPERWVAWDQQDWKREKAEAAQKFLGGAA